MPFHFRLKDLKIAAVFLILYSFIITFHLIRRLEDRHLKGLSEDLKQFKFNSDISKHSKEEENENVQERFDLFNKDQHNLEIILQDILLNKNPGEVPGLYESNVVRAGVRRSALTGDEDDGVFFDDGDDDNHDDTDSAAPPGHMGAPVIINPLTLAPHDKVLYDKGWGEHNFNQFVSDKIALDRELSDLRHPRCRKRTYEWRLPKMSVIICFHNEAWTTLLRTVHSVLKRTPPNLLEEIILVDDFSTMEHLRANLTSYAATLPKVKVIRTSKREGLVRARLLGTDVAKGETITFLDSHCECLPGWAEPLLARIKEDPSVVVWPVIPAIDKETFAVQRGSEKGVANKGGFYWDMHFKWVPLTQTDRDNRVDVTSPIRSPTMAGGIFTINKNFFKHLGTYDPNFEFWGAENMELSFKIWMCGGSLEILPCSVVGHVFRDTSPMHVNYTTIVRNSQRVAEIWLDEYKDIYYENIGTKLGDIGDLTSQLDLRRNLKCRSFDWYIKTIYPEVFLPSQALRRGKLHLSTMREFCLDAGQKRAYNKPVRLTACRSYSMTQFWYLTRIGELRTGYECLDIGLDSSFRTVQFAKCHGQMGNQFWQYTQNQTLRKSKLNRCLTVNPETNDVSLQVCNQNISQEWIWEPFNI